VKPSPFLLKGAARMRGNRDIALLLTPSPVAHANFAIMAPMAAPKRVLIHGLAVIGHAPEEHPTK
jgi:hypothetical protein